jgi:2Fe-2S ferredoxin
MTRIVYVHPSGKRLSVMQAATSRGVDRILAKCSANAMCATCHVYVDRDWIDRLPPMNAEEDALLECTASERRSNSRLGSISGLFR